MKSWLLKNELLSFTLLAFGLSWALWLPVVLSGPGMPAWAIPFHILGGLGPFAAAVIKKWGKPSFEPDGFPRS